MPHYRIYFLNDKGRIRHAVDIECPTDDDALRVVQERKDGRAMELWEGARKVAEISKPAD